MLRAAFVGAALCAGIFLGAAELVGLQACVPDDVFSPAFTVANGPARVAFEVWPDSPLQPQLLQHDCGGGRAHLWRRTPFLFWGLVVYGGLGALAGALARGRFGE